jgi:membrane protease YdiL (CAAX protease family)
MIKNIFIHFLTSVIVSFSAAFLLDHYTYCESMCGLYYVSSVAYLLPIFFLLGLPIPIGLKKYPKEKSEYAFKRKLCLIFGLVGMLSILSYFVISFYSVAHSKNITVPVDLTSTNYIHTPTVAGGVIKKNLYSLELDCHKSYACHDHYLTISPALAVSAKILFHKDNQHLV